jgi:hypothetical protein
VGLLVLVAGQVADADVACKLHIEGFGYQHGLKKAHLSCTGGSIKAVAHPLLTPLVGAKAGVTSSGVQWLDSCGTNLTQSCLLTVCDGSKATFLSAAVVRVNVTAIPDFKARDRHAAVQAMGLSSHLCARRALPKPPPSLCMHWQRWSC